MYQGIGGSYKKRYNGRRPPFRSLLPPSRPAPNGGILPPSRYLLEAARGYQAPVLARAESGWHANLRLTAAAIHNTVRF